jgi:hypothetical protein
MGTIMWPLRNGIAFGFLLAAIVTVGAEEIMGGNARNSALPRECAMRDPQLVDQLEQHDMRSETAQTAFLAIMRARRACYDARVPEGLALYDNIQALISVAHAK